MAWSWSPKTYENTNILTHHGLTKYLSSHTSVPKLAKSDGLDYY